MEYIEYTPENLNKISNLIVNNLSLELLPKKWYQRNLTNPKFGHCHNASGCLYKVFGPKSVSLQRAIDDEGIYHWWIKDKSGMIIDLTVEQYTSTGRLPPHDKGEKAGLLGFEYKNRVMKLYDKVMFEYKGNLNIFELSE